MYTWSPLKAIYLVDCKAAKTVFVGSKDCSMLRISVCVCFNVYSMLNLQYGVKAAPVC